MHVLKVNEPFVFHYNFRYACEQYLTRHLKYHYPTKDFICEICGAAKPTLDTLKKHEKKVHAPKVAAQCKYCGKWYAARSHMLRHVLNMHTTADTEHRCEICGFVSTTRTALRQHKRFKHNPEKKHKCTMCEKAFKTPTLLKVSPKNQFHFVLSGQFSNVIMMATCRSTWLPILE